LEPEARGPFYSLFIHLLHFRNKRQQLGFKHFPLLFQVELRVELGDDLLLVREEEGVKGLTDEELIQGDVP
jgi:hypothetical protein